MKGFMIYEAPLWGNEENVVYLQEVKDASYTLKQFGSDDITCYLEGTATKDPVTKATCNKEDTYDFKTGALIALMKMCGRDKVTKACDELYKDDNYKNALQEVTESLDSLSKKYDLVVEGYDYWKEQCKKLDKENKKLQRGYIDTDMIFCGGRQNGKQYTLLVDLFKKIDQKKVDEAYKEAYNTTLPVWQKEVLNQMYGVYKESKEKPELPRTLDINGTVYRKSIQIKDFGEQINKLTVDSLIEQSRAFTRKCVDEWLYRIPTKRDEMWENILSASKCPPVEIKVAKEDVTSFLRELQDKIPEARWNGSDCPPLEYTNPYWFKHDYIYFALFRNDDKGSLRMCYDEKPHSWINKPVIIYLPPMRWDLFKKGRLAVKVIYNNYKEFYDACERELGKKPSTYSMLWDDVTISICKKDGNFEIFNMEHQKKIGRKIVNWEDVR